MKLQNSEGNDSSAAGRYSSRIHTHVMALIWLAQAGSREASTGHFLKQTTGVHLEPQILTEHLGHWTIVTTLKI